MSRILPILAAVCWLTAIAASTSAQPAPAPAPPDARAFDEAVALYQGGSYEEALPVFERLAQQKHAESAYIAGLMHDRGRGTRADGAKALQYYSTAAEANHPAALCNLGILHRDGAQGVRPDPAKAEEYLRRAAYLDNAPAQLALGAMQYNGNQIARDEVEGLAWFMIASDNGDEIAKKNLDGLYPSMPPQTRQAATAKVAALREQMAAIARLTRQQPTAPQGGGDAPGGADADVSWEKAQSPDGKSVWRVKSIKPDSDAARLGYEAGDLLLSAQDASGNPIDVRPEAGPEALGRFLSLRSFKATLHRPSLAAQGEDPLVNLTVHRAD